jgi:hypothetical protein
VALEGARNVGLHEQVVTNSSCCIIKNWSKVLQHWARDLDLNVPSIGRIGNSNAVALLASFLLSDAVEIQILIAVTSSACNTASRRAGRILISLALIQHCNKYCLEKYSFYI